MTSLPHPALAGPPLETTRARVLMVDDHPANLLALRALLDDLGLELVEATSGEEALERTAHDDFAVILLDVCMPGMDGFEVAERMRQNEATARTPVLFLTANDVGPDSLERGYGLGAVDFLSKPLLPAALRAKVRGMAELYIDRQRARREAEQLRLLVDGAQDYSMFLLDPEGYIISWNPGAQRIKQYRESEIVGKHFSCFYTQEAIDRDWPAYELEMATKVGRFEDEGWRVRKDGSLFWANVIITALRGATGQLRGFSKITRDTTERKQAEESRRRLAEELAARRAAEENARVIREQQEQLRAQSEEARSTALRLNLALSSAALGDWTWDVASDMVTMSDRAAEIFGIPSGPQMTWTQMRQMLHADDLPATQAAVERAVNDKLQYDVQYRVNRPDGTQVWVAAAGVAQYNADGQPLGMFGLVEDITERKRLEESLRVADQRKDEFLATLAHELRNPLAPIRNGLQILRMPGVDAGTCERTRDMMDRQLTHLVRLVDDLLDVSRITRNKLDLRMQDVDLATAVQSAVETSQPLVTDRRHQLEVSLPEQPLHVNADATRLAQILANLLNNSVKYSDPGRRIWLTVAQQDSQAVIKVRDEGFGIPADELDSIFELFTQVERHQTHASGGLGIGLMLVKRLVELHGGSITAESAGLGRGSVFTVTLPLKQAPAKAAAPAPAPAAAAPARPRGKRVLVVDDNRDAATSLSMILKLLGNEVRMVHDGLQAVAAAREFAPQVIFLDIGLPGLDGYGACRKIRELAGGDQMLIVALTGWGQEEDRRRSSDAGFNHHLVKPVNPADLQQLVAG